MLALSVSSSRIQSSSIPNVITEATESGSSNMSSLFIDKLTGIIGDLSTLVAVVVVVNNSRY